MEWFKVFPPDVLNSDDFVRKVTVSGKTLCIVKTEDKIYAVQNKCPHAGADLSGGWCRGGKLVCPYHRHEFDLVTGRGAAGQGNYVNTYPVEKREDGVYVGMNKAWWKFWCF